MSRRHWTVAAAVGLVVTLAACSSDDPSSTASSTTVAPTETADEPASPTTATASDAASTTAAASTTSATSTSTTSSVPDEPATRFAEVAGAPIDLLTPATGNGPKPLLTWEPVAGASTYDVIVNTLDGGPYWTWRGTTAEVWLGGHETEPDADTEGPVLTEPMLLTVVATDDSGTLLAGIGPVEIAP